MWDGLTGSAYHDNGQKAFDNLTKRAYNRYGNSTGAKNFRQNVALGTGFSRQISSDSKIKVYNRVIH